MALPGNMRGGVAGSTEFLSARTGSTLNLFWVEKLTGGATERGLATISLYSSHTGVVTPLGNIGIGQGATKADDIIAEGNL